MLLTHGHRYQGRAEIGWPLSSFVTESKAVAYLTKRGWTDVAAWTDSDALPSDWPADQREGTVFVKATWSGETSEQTLPEQVKWVNDMNLTDPVRPVVTLQAISTRQDLSAPNAALQLTGSMILTASMAASAFHGYRRNKSVGWALAMAEGLRVSQIAKRLGVGRSTLYRELERRRELGAPLTVPKTGTRRRPSKPAKSNAARSSP